MTAVTPSFNQFHKGKYLMSIFTISLTTVFLLTIVGCNNEAADSKEQMKGAVSLGSEITLEGELPSILTSGLSPEEKSKLTEEILPMASPDDPEPEEKFQKLRETQGMEHDGLLLPEKIADTYYHLAQQHRSAWTHELDLRAHTDMAWWNNKTMLD